VTHGNYVYVVGIVCTIMVAVLLLAQPRR
jgi:hypothetical protein